MSLDNNVLRAEVEANPCQEMKSPGGLLVLRSIFSNFTYNWLPVGVGVATI